MSASLGVSKFGNECCGLFQAADKPVCVVYLSRRIVRAIQKRPEPACSSHP
jgi:hypothetical protein